MIVPSKFTSFDDSILRKMLKILEKESNVISISDLFDKLQKHFIDIDDYLFSLDVLYLLGSIDIDTSKGILRYAKRNSL